MARLITACESVDNLRTMLRGDSALGHEADAAEMLKMFEDLWKVAAVMATADVASMKLDREASAKLTGGQSGPVYVCPRCIGSGGPVTAGGAAPTSPEEVQGLLGQLDDDAKWRDAAGRLLLLTRDQPKLVLAIALAIELPDRLRDARATAVLAKILEG